MVGRPTMTAQTSRLDRLYCELVDAVKVSEDEVAAVSSSGYLYDRVRLRIAEIGGRTKPRRSLYDRLRSVAAARLSIPHFVVLSSAAAILAALVLGLVALLSSPSSPDSAPTQTQAALSTVPDQTGPTPPGSTERNDRINITRVSATNRFLQSQRKRQRSANRTSEVATDFLPLTYVDDLSAEQSGHIVRMKVPRSALIAFGVPMNMERAGELITADVMIGDDGLARAIRFVQ